MKEADTKLSFLFKYYYMYKKFEWGGSRERESE